MAEVLATWQGRPAETPQKFILSNVINCVTKIDYSPIEQLSNSKRTILRKYATLRTFIFKILGHIIASQLSCFFHF